MAKEKPFFIGWESETPKPLVGFVGFITVLVLVGGLAIAGVAAALQQTVGPGTWDFTESRFEGVFVAEPVPMLIEESDNGQRLHFLVKPFKYGFSAEEASQFHLKKVGLTASFLSTDVDSMLEVVSEIEVLDDSALPQSPLAKQTVDGICVIRGEIVDSKCWLGAMNPGTFKPHRACAIQCIRGGIPVGFLARDTAGNHEFFLLMGPNGEALNDVVLDYVAEPIEVSGVLSYAGSQPILRINPDQIVRLAGKT
ncbi:MAG: hypothetical protein AAGH89_15355 [Verrucomicrobiota bacterium]